LTPYSDLVTILLLNASIKKAFNPKGGVWPVKKEAPFPDGREMELFLGGFLQWFRVRTNCGLFEDKCHEK
jgi:hypothetical protein